MSGLLDKAKEAEASKKVVTESIKIEPEVSEPVTNSSTEIKSSKFNYIMSNGMGIKIGAVIVTLLVLFVGYQVAMGFSFGSGSMTITEHSIEEDNDALKIQIRFGNPMFSSASKDTVQISVSYGDEEVLTTTATPSSNLLNL